MRSRCARVMVLVLASLGSASQARADDAAARQSFKRGVELYDKKQFQAALEQFQKAFAEKASPVIEQNIALSLKGLGKPIEAATAFDEALDDEKGELGAETRTAIERELVELAKVVATVRLSTVGVLDHKPLTDVVISVDGRALTAAQQRRPVRLAPGIHVFTAHAPKLPDPPEKRLSLLAGSPVDATFEIGVPVGNLLITPVVTDGATATELPGALIQVDGVTVAKGSWPLRLPSGSHRVTVSAPGYQITTADVVVSAGASVEYPVALARPSAAPPPYDARQRRASPPTPMKSRYIVPMLAYEAQSFRLSPALGGEVGGTKHSFTGVAVLVRGGYRLGKNIALELQGEVGQVSSSYHLSDVAGESSTTVTQWQVAPGARFVTPGGIRFTIGMMVGVHGQVVTSTVDTGPATQPREVKGNGVSVSWIGDLGMQFDVGPLWLEGVGFLNVHGVGTTTDDANDRLFYSSPSTRAGVRVGLGVPF